MTPPLDDKQEDRPVEEADDVAGTDEHYGPEPQPEGDENGYRFVNKESGLEYPVDQVYYEATELNCGDVIDINEPETKTKYYTVDSIEEGFVSTVYLVRAKNTLWKTVLMLAVLGASWYVIDFIFERVF